MLDTELLEEQNMLELGGPIQGDTLSDLVFNCESRMVRAVLKSMRGNVTDAAAELGLARNSLYATMKRLRIPTGHGQRKGTVRQGVKVDG